MSISTLQNQFGIPLRGIYSVGLVAVLRDPSGAVVGWMSAEPKHTG